MSGKLRKNRLIRCPPVPHTNLHHHRLPSTVKLSVVPPSSSSVCQHIPAIPVEMRQVRNPSVDGCEILHQLVDGLSHDLQGFNTFQPSVWWCRISQPSTVAQNPGPLHWLAFIWNCWETASSGCGCLQNDPSMARNLHLYIYRMFHGFVPHVWLPKDKLNN